MANENQEDYTIHFNNLYPNEREIQITENYIGKNNNTLSFVSVPRPAPDHIELIKKLIELKKSKCLIFYDFVVLMTFNINFAHFCFHSLNQSIGIIPSVIIFILMTLFSYAFQASFMSFILKLKAFNFGMLLEEHFGSLCVMIYEILALIWLGLCFLSTFVTCETYIREVFALKEGNGISLYHYLISGGFFILILLINSFQSSTFINLSVFFSFFLNIFTLAFVIFTLCKLDIKSESIPYFNKNAEINDYFQGISIYSSVMNTIIILFYVNMQLKDFNLSNKISKIILFINYLINFLFYSVFIIEGMFTYEKTTNDDHDTHFLIFLIQNNKKTTYHILLIVNILYEILLTTFYFYVLKTTIFRANTREYFKGKRYFLYFSAILIIIFLMGLALNNPYEIIMLNNSSFGFLVNFVFPCKCLVI